MHLGIAGGVKLKITNFIGLRLQARILTPLWFKGEYFSMDSFGSIVSFKKLRIGFQGDFSASVILIIPKNPEGS
jgi:hypothetical protein